MKNKLVSELIKNHNDEQKIIDNYNLIVQTVEQNRDIHTLTIGKLKTILNSIGIAKNDIENHSQHIEQLDEVLSIELQALVGKLGSINTYDPIELEPIFKAGLTLLSKPDKMEIFKTSLLDAIKEPIPPGLEFPYSGEAKIKLRAGVPTIIGAYTGIGKSSVMINLAYYYYNYEPTVKQWIYSLEMSASDIAVNLLQVHLETNKKYDTQETNFYSVKTNYSEHTDTLKEIEERITVFTNDRKTNFIGIEEIELRVEYAAATNTLPSIIYIDYLQIISPEDSSLDARMQIINIMGRLTQLAKKYKFYLVILAQANRASVEPKTTGAGLYIKAPDMNTLQESSFIEQASGLVVMLGRIYTGKSSNDDYMEFKVEKNRFGASRMSNFYEIIKESKTIKRKVIDDLDLKK